MSTLEDRVRAALTAKSDAVAFSMLTRSLPPLADPEPDATPVLLLPPVQSHRPPRTGWLVAAAVAAVAVLLVAFGAVALHRSTHQFDPAHVRPRSAIPWEKVGPGWTLMQETPKVVLNGHHLAGVQQVQLVDPSEHRYQISPVAAGWYLLIWDGQHRHAIFFGGPVEPSAGQPYESAKLMVMDLVDGIQHTFTVPSFEQLPHFSSDGQTVIFIDPLHKVERYSLTGQPQQPRRPIPSSQLVADSPDGRQAIVDGRAGLEVYDYASGLRVGNLPPPSDYAGCYDPRWEADGKLIANCLQVSNRTKVGTFVFSAGGKPGAGRADPAYVGATDHRVTGFRQGAVSTYYPEYDKNPTPESFPSLTHLTATRLDAAGHTVRIPVPAQLENSRSMIVSSTPDAFTVINYLGSDSSLYTAAVSWNPFTGQVTELVQAAAPTEALISVQPWGSQPY